MKLTISVSLEGDSKKGTETVEVELPNTFCGDQIEAVAKGIALAATKSARAGFLQS